MPASSQPTPPTPPTTATAITLAETAHELSSESLTVNASQQLTVRTALRCLAAFAENQIRLFGGGFAPGGALTPEPKFSGAFLLETLVRQLTFDIDLFQRALSQRTPSCSTAALRELLAQADRLAAAALAPAATTGLVAPTAPLSYLQKSPTVRLLPYAPVALIGLDLAAVGDPLRLVAIAHEVGHQVYRQFTVADAQDLDAEIETMAAATPAPWPDWLLAWTEEIFADVYSALIAGPVAGLSLVQLLTNALPAALVTDDGDHPLPALRPTLVVTVLHHLSRLAEHSNQSLLLENAASALEQSWHGYLAAAGSLTTFTPAGSAESLRLDDAQALLAAYAEEMLDGELAPIACAKGYRRWSEGLATANPAALVELTEQLLATLANLATVTVPWLALTAQGDHVVVLPQAATAQNDPRALGQTGVQLLDTLRAEAIAGQRTLAPDEWKAVFTAGGWVTEQGGSGITPPIFGRARKPSRRPTRPLQPGQKRVSG